MYILCTYLCLFKFINNCTRLNLLKFRWCLGRPSAIWCMPFSNPQQIWRFQVLDFIIVLFFWALSWLSWFLTIVTFLFHTKRSPLWKYNPVKSCMDGMLSNRCLKEIIQTNQCGFALVKIRQFLKQTKCKKCALYFRLVANQYHSEEKPPSIRRLCFSIGQWWSFIQKSNIRRRC